MANRSYLYSINEIPGIKPEQLLTVKGMSETSYRIPITYLILVSGHSTICDSLLFTEKSCLVGNYQEGVENLKAFGKLMNQSKIKNLSLFNAQLEQSIKFLSQAEIQQPYIYLELGEIFAMGNDDIKSIKINLENIVKAMNNQDLALLKECDQDYDIFDYWETALSLDCWQKILYYDFPKPVNYKTPFGNQNPNELSSKVVNKQADEKLNKEERNNVFNYTKKAADKVIKSPLFEEIINLKLPAKSKYFIMYLLIATEPQTGNKLVLTYDFGKTYCSKVNPGETLKSVIDKEIPMLIGSSEYKFIKMVDGGTALDKFGSSLPRFNLYIEIPYFNPKDRNLNYDFSWRGSKQ